MHSSLSHASHAVMVIGAHPGAPNHTGCYGGHHWSCEGDRDARRGCAPRPRKFQPDAVRESGEAAIFVTHATVTPSPTGRRSYAPAWRPKIRWRNSRGRRGERGAAPGSWSGKDQAGRAPSGRL